MPRIPEIHVPLWQRLPSGLLVPGSLTARAQLAPVDAELPAELALPRVPIAIIRQAPAFTDQVAVRPGEEDLGLTPSDLPFLIGLAEGVPFEPAMLAVSRLAAALWHIHLDGAAQLELARSFFDDAGIVGLYTSYLREGDNHVLFSEQQFFVTQRILVEHARLGVAEAGLDSDEASKLKRLIVGAATIVDQAHLDVERIGTAQEIGAYLAQNGAYNARQNLLATYTRAYSLFVDRAGSDHRPDRVPLDEWVAEDFSLSLAEQIAAGFALQAVAHALDEVCPVAQRSLINGDALRTTALRDRMNDVREMLAARRDWYRVSFADDQSLAAVVWETTPFMQRPFLELESGQLLLLSPRSIISWMGDGFYYRLLDAARRRNDAAERTSVAFTSYVGTLLEGWALDLVRSAYPGDRPPGAGRVFGEQSYGDHQLTPDIAIDLGEDLVLIEVRSGYLTRELRVNGQVADFLRDLDRVLLRKVNQLGNAITAVLDGRATLPDVDLHDVRRIWPIVVTVNVTQSEPLHDLVEVAQPPVYRDARVQSLLILDAEDLELLVGMVEAGLSLAGILAARQASPYRKLEFVRWANEDPYAVGVRGARSRATEALWRRVTAEMINTLQIRAA